MLKRMKLFQGKDKSWYFHVKGDNGEIVATSESYSTKSAAKIGAKTLISLILQDLVDAVRR